MRKKTLGNQTQDLSFVVHKYSEQINCLNLKLTGNVENVTQHKCRILQAHTSLSVIKIHPVHAYWFQMQRILGYFDVKGRDLQSSPQRNLRHPSLSFCSAGVTKPRRGSNVSKTKTSRKENPVFPMEGSGAATRPSHVPLRAGWNKCWELRFVNTLSPGLFSNNRSYF